LEPFAGLAAPVKTYASAIALEELAISAAAGAFPSSSCSIEAELQFFANRDAREEAVDMSKDAEEQFNESERRLYLSFDPSGPF
jgi:hypothetical protein